MWKKKQTEEPKNKDITRESYLQTVFRRFRRHHLAAVSLVTVSYTHLQRLCITFFRKS